MPHTWGPSEDCPTCFAMTTREPVAPTCIFALCEKTAADDSFYCPKHEREALDTMHYMTTRVWR